jgi:hypothetical protein
MFKKLILMIAAITIFAAVPAFAAATGCNKIKFQGTYTRASLNNDVLGDGTVVHSWVFQLVLNSDGTASLSSTAYLDLLVNLGSNSTAVGAWTCRPDGKLVVSMLSGLYFPIPPATNGQLPAADISLERHYRTTYLFSVDDVNTLTQIQSRSRRYTPTQDPTDPAGGTLLNANNTQQVYTRFSASDADLLAP